MDDREKLIELQKSNCVHGKECHGECFACMADHLIANGVTFASDNNVGRNDVPDNNVGKWIPVTERLPSVWMSKYDEGILEPLEFIVFIKNAELPTVKFFNGKNFCDDNGYIYDVTFWMPLPEPPKGE